LSVRFAITSSILTPRAAITKTSRLIITKAATIPCVGIRARSR
jgi:hypothetical protein